jgi:hypothetical protein
MVVDEARRLYASVAVNFLHSPLAFLQGEASLREFDSNLIDRVLRGALHWCGPARSGTKAKAMKIFIQQTTGGRYWSHQDGWVQTREAATVYAGVVAAIDAFITDRLVTADIVMTFGVPSHDTPLGRLFVSA